MWYVYILKCTDGTFYTGITTDLDRRIKEHNFSKKSAKYTSGRRPVKLVYSDTFKNQKQASKEEHRIKALTREKKLELIS